MNMVDHNGYGVDYGDAYMEQEEEWEREGLLDPAWEKQQKKVRAFSPLFFTIHVFNILHTWMENLSKTGCVDSFSDDDKEAAPNCTTKW